MHTLNIIKGDVMTPIHFEGAAALSDLLNRGGYSLEQPCGGRGACGKCRVRAEGALDPAPDARGLCLACQTRCLGDARVWVGESASFERIQVDGLMPEIGHNPGPGRYGVAVDVGTTTLAVRLFDLQRGAPLDAASSVNPQRAVAADVIGRIEAALSGRGEELKALAGDQIRALVSGLRAEPVDQWVITGNTTMLTLLTGRSPESLSHAPFEADCLFGFGEDNVYYPPCPSAFVGADIACAVLASGMHRAKETALLMDIGTNGEICLWHGGKLYCCATAAGPAFEGVGISCGVGSVRGAIDSVALDESGAPRVTTIAGAAPVGVCGSGLIDAVAAFLDAEAIDETGYVEEEELPLAPGVALTPKDIRAVQLAKGAIAAGLYTLCATAGVSLDAVRHLYVAGGFGSHLNIPSAARIGLIPEQLSDRVRVLGNAALTGASMLLLDRDLAEEASALARAAESVNLGGSALFSEYYMEKMLFE